ncbi:MAG TPA: hypothetical protein VMZ91_02245 [Candidatus Paceibacterota bacterium]|nr:hypothetical protein [Candidatus Paceibacterota bacterium]
MSNPTEEDINRNLKNVDEGKDLDISLCVLNGEFKKRYFGDKETQRKLKRKEYCQKPEVKARQKEYNQKPEVKAKRKVCQKKYYQKPEVKARMKVYYKEYYQKMKKENDTNT